MGQGGRERGEWEGQALLGRGGGVKGEVVGVQGGGGRGAQAGAHEGSVGRHISLSRWMRSSIHGRFG